MRIRPRGGAKDRMKSLCRHHVLGKFEQYQRAEAVRMRKQLRSLTIKGVCIVGFPFISPHRKWLSETRKCIAERIRNAALNVHIENGFGRFCEVVRELTDDFLHWPGGMFYKEDNLCAILGYVPGICVEMNDVLIPLCLIYGISKANACRVVALLTKESTVGDLYDRILSETNGREVMSVREAISASALVPL